MATYNVNITNGTGTESVLNGSYNVSANANGYDNTSILPKTIEVVEGTNEYSLSIAATGTLTVHVTEEGIAGGTAIVGATFVRTDASGTQYGDVITTTAEGNAIFNNVPFATTDAPTIYYKQTASDGAHEFSSEVRSINLTSQTGTVEIQNARPIERTFTLTDANYANIPIGTATITLTE